MRLNSRPDHGELASERGVQEGLDTFDAILRGTKDGQVQSSHTGSDVTVQRGGTADATKPEFAVDRSDVTEGNGR